MVFYLSKFATDTHLILGIQSLTETKFDSIWTSLYTFYFCQGVAKANSTNKQVDNNTKDKSVSSNS